MTKQYKSIKITEGPHAGMYFRPVEETDNSRGVHVKYQAPDKGPCFGVQYSAEQGKYTLAAQRQLVRIAFSSICPVGVAWSKKNSYMGPFASD